VDYLPRLIDSELLGRMGSFAAVMVVGPRACGKTTSAARLAASVVRLDQPAIGNVFRADPDAALAGRVEPVLLDEWQDVAEVLGAVKRSVDADSRAGRFVLTGSVSGQLDAVSWPGTGRLVRLEMFGLTMRERLSHVDSRPSIDGLLSGEVHLPADRPDLVGYVDLALVGGFPEVVRLRDAADRRLWLDSYVDQLVTRDVARVSGGRDPERLRRYLQAWALNSAGLADDTTIYGAVGIDRRTHVAYEQVLRNTYSVDVVPAWTSNRLKRLVLSPKRYVVDPALMAAAARIGRSDIIDNADLLGRLIDTFVVAELRSHLAVEPGRPTLAHIRTGGGRNEVDLVVEYDGGRVFGIEIKATSVPRSTDARHLFWLAEQLGDRFAGGVVFHTGPELIELGPGVLALPICSLWGDHT
jgi:predicted AAA+ superfamily ATPase